MLDRVDWKSTCAAVIPSYNEASCIGAVVVGVRNWLPKVIVVDDGSTDGTADCALAAGATVVRTLNNRGKGAALRAGWLHAAGLGFEWVLMLDGDGQHAPADIQVFLESAENTTSRLVVGNRMNDARSMPWHRRGINRWMSRRLSQLTGCELPDSQCGFRLGHLPTLLALRLDTDRFEIESQMLVECLAAGATVRFVPIQTIYIAGASKISPLADSWRWLRWWAVCAWARKGSARTATLYPPDPHAVAQASVE